VDEDGGALVEAFGDELCGSEEGDEVLEPRGIVDAREDGVVGSGERLDQGVLRVSHRVNVA